jgi:hypothetical protein
MPDAEQIVLEIDERPAVAAVDRANKAIGSHEQSVKTFMDNAGRKWESYGDTVVRVNDKSRSSLDRLIKSMEQQAAVAGKSGVEKLVAERDILIRKWGDEEKAVQAITKAYAAKIEAEKASSSSMQAFGQNAQMFLQNPMQGAQSAITGAAQAMGPFGIATVGTVTALVAVGTAAYGAMKSLGEYGTEIRNTALRTGLSTQEVQAFGFAAKMVGQDVSIFERSMRGLTMAVEDNSAKGMKAREWLERFGVDIRGLKDGTAGTAETFERIAAGLGSMSNPLERNKALLDLFKRSGIEMAPVLDQLQSSIDKFHQHGFGMTDEELARTKRYQEQVVLISTAWEEAMRSAKQYFAELASVLVSPSPALKMLIGMSLQLPASFQGSPGGSSEPRFQEGRNLTAERIAAAAGSQNDAAVRAYLASQGLPGQLKTAEAKLSTMAAPQLGVSTAQDVTDYQKQERTVQALKDQIKNQKDQAEYAKRMAEADQSQTRRDYERVLEANKKLEKYRELFEPGYEAPAYRSEIKEEDQPALQYLKGLSRGTLAVPSGYTSGQQARRDASNTQQMQLRMLGSQATLSGMSPEDKSAAGYQIRIQAANAEYAADIQLAKTAADESTAKDARQQKYFDAEMDRQQALADHQVKLFEEIKGKTEGLLHTLFTDPKNFGKQLESTVRNAALRPIEDRLSTAIAAPLSGIFGGHSSSNLAVISTDSNTAATNANTAALYAHSGAVFGGAAGGLGGFSAARGGTASFGLPSFSSIWGGSGSAGGGALPSMAGMPDVSGGFGPGSYAGGIGPGGTSGFAGALGGGGTSGKGAFSGILGGPQGGLFNKSNWGVGTAISSKMSGGTTLGSVLGSRSAAGLEGAAGAPLMTAGLLGNARGTGLGIFEGAIGGAGVGAAIGSVIPGLGTGIGAAIGAGAGALAGVGEMIAGDISPRAQVKKLVTQMYHTAIGNAEADQIVKLADDKYGKQYSVAVRSPEVRQMLGLYAAGTGQAKSFPMGADTPHGAGLIESGGGLSQEKMYQYGNAYTYSSNLPVYGGGSTGNLPSPGGGGGGTSMSFNISGADVNHFLSGNVFTPEATQSNYSASLAGSNGRMQNELDLSEPGSIVA